MNTYAVDIFRPSLGNLHARIECATFEEARAQAIEHNRRGYDVAIYHLLTTFMALPSAPSRQVETPPCGRRVSVQQAATTS